MSGALSCWGLNTYGQLTAPSIGQTYLQVSASMGSHTCAIRTSGAVECWGYNNFGQINAPAGVFVQVSAGVGHSCAIRADGTMACWGANNAGQASPPAGRFTRVAASFEKTCAVRAEGGLTCFGGAGSVIQIQPNTLPDALWGQAYSVQFTATGTSGANTYTITNGTLPAGFTLTPNGLLSGTYFGIVDANYMFTVRVTDSTGAFAEQAYTLRAFAPPS
jgi:hypothetical protein